MNLFRLALDCFGWERLSTTRKRHEELKEIMAKTAQELADEIKASTAQTRKGIDEVMTKIRNLEDIINAGGDLSSIENAVADLKTASQVLDDIVPDAPTP